MGIAPQAPQQRLSLSGGFLLRVVWGELSQVATHKFHPDTLVIRTPHQNRDASSTERAMPPTQNTQQSQKEGRLALSIHAIQNKQVSSYRKAEKLYQISRSTLHDRVHGTQPQAQANAQKRKLHPTEEQALVEWILDLDQHEDFQP
ncbi:transposase [Paraphaeosphaeria minitans]|uniref:Transposase n=1 Tax=Paraphaeosphaeria minitans TaxID=565426 RepID=A0A9P6G9K3_9PLEO|nr:transposase [Paraphaeosphaeria minitans]